MLGVKGQVCFCGELFCQLLLRLIFISALSSSPFVSSLTLCLVFDSSSWFTDTALVLVFLVSRAGSFLVIRLLVLIQLILLLIAWSVTSTYSPNNGFNLKKYGQDALTVVQIFYKALLFSPSQILVLWFSPALVTPNLSFALHYLCSINCNWTPITVP